jgi:hypothetical protein
MPLFLITVAKVVCIGAVAVGGSAVIAMGLGFAGAGIQAGIGNVVAGSLLAGLQSLGAAGVLQTAAIAAGAVVSVAGAALGKL